MKKSKRVISLLLSVLMLVSVFQTGFVAFAADSTGYVLGADEAKILPDAGAVTTSTQVVRVASGLYSYQVGTTIVPATPSGIPAMNGEYESNSLANTGDINETASYPQVKITFEELPTDVPQITCVNSKSATNNIVMSTAVYNPTEKSYTWLIASGTANAKDTLQFKITYNYNGKQYTSSAYSYVENIAQPAGSFVTTESRYESGLFGWGSNYYSGVSVASRVLGINTYGSLESFTTNSSDLRGYYNASLNTFVMRASADYATYGITRSQSTRDKDEPLVYNLNDRRSYADVYVDTSVTNSFADLNLRYAVAKVEKIGGNDTQNLDAIVTSKGNVKADSSLQGTGDFELGTKASIGEMEIADQYITTFSGGKSTNGFVDGAEYTIVTKLSSAHSGAANTTYFPVGLRIHTVDKGALRALINDILHNYTPESPLTSAAYKGVNPQSWYYSAGFSEYETAMLSAQTILQNPKASQTEIDDAITSLTNAYNGLVLKEADYSGITTATEAALDLEKTKDLYTVESYANLQKAISVYNADTNSDGIIQPGFSVLFQPQVDEWEKGIYDAIDALEFRRADYSDLDAVYAKALEAEANIHKYLDFSGVRIAMNNIDWNVKITEQKKVTEMTTILSEALDNLKFKPADYTAVNEAVKKAQSYTASNYTADSYANLRDLLRDIDYTLDMGDQDVVDNYVVQIEEAIANLDELPADYAELEALLLQVSRLVEEYYYPETYQAAKDAAAACEGYTEIGITRQEEIDAMTASLKKAVDGLVMYDADYSEIEDLIEEYSNMDLSQITKDSILAVDDAIAAVKYELKIDKQSEVDNYALAISTAIRALAYEPADYSRVTFEVERASAIDRTYWTTESLAELDAAVAAVKYGLGVNRQEEVDAMANAIKDAISYLQAGPADYSRVHTAIANFEALNPNHYTPASIAAVRAVIDSVNWNLTKDEQSRVLEYAFDISQAQLGLQKAKADYTDLIALQKTVPENLESQYTEKSIDALENVLNSINWNLYAEDQHIVVGYQNALTEAIVNLKYLTGDYSAVDAAIAEGRAIIAKNDPPIAKESIDAFESLVASLDRTYTIKQEAEISALAAAVRAAYSQFGYAEAIHKASIELVGDKSASFPGDIVTVSVIVGTDYYAAASSIPVLYDTNFYELVGTSVSDVFQFEGSYAEASEKGGNINSPSKGYPSSYTAEDKQQWKYALVTLGPDSSIREDAQILTPSQKVFSIQFRVLNNYTVGNYKARIWIDEAFLKTEDNKTGKLYIGRYETAEVSNNVVSMGQSIDLSKASIQLSVIDPNSPADFSELQIAILTTPQYDASFYTPETYKVYADAVSAGEEVKSHTEYTVKDQPIVDAATKAINDAYAALELRPADLEPLRTALALLPEYPADHYTSDTYSEYATAYSNGQEIFEETNLTIADNFRINAAAKAITDAFNSLTVKPFSHSLLMNTWLNKAPEYSSEFYTADSYKEYADAYAALENFKNSEPTFLDDTDGLNLIYALRDAYNLLTLDEANKKPLEDAINAPLDYDASFYTDETYAEYQNAIDAGNAILAEEGLTIIDNERIQAAADAITAAAGALGFKPFSYTADLTKAMRLPAASTNVYTAESVQAYNAAKQALTTFNRKYPATVRNITHDAEAKQLIDAVNDAYANLKPIPADLTLLNQALSLETYDEQYYEEGTYQAYKDALAAVEAYGEDYYWKKAEQTIVDGLAQDIIDAHTALKLKPFTKLPDLETAITVVPEDDSSYYEEDTYAEYEAARKVITDMIDNAANLTILDDEAAVKAIEDYNAAYEALKYVSKIVLKDEADAYLTEEGYLKGLDFYNVYPEGEETFDEATERYIKEQFRIYGDNTSIVVIPTINGYGTGTIVQHYDGDELVKEYVVVINGDADGSGYVDNTDVTIVIGLINEFAEPETEYVMAAIDLENDGWLDAIDLTIVINMANFMF